MPAKSKVVKKSVKPAPKSATKAAAKPAVKKPSVKVKTAKVAKKSPGKAAPAKKKIPVKKPAPKAAKPAKPVAKKAAPAKTAVKSKSKPSAPKKVGSKVASPAAKKPQKAAPIKVKSKTPAKKATPAKAAKPAPVKAAKPVNPEPAAKKAEAVKPEPAPAAPAKAAGKPAKVVAPKGSGAAPAIGKNFNASGHIKSVSRRPQEENIGATIEIPKIVKSSPFLKRQRQRLLELRSMLLDSMESVADGSLRSRPEGSEASAFGQHMADAGSDAYDRDFALSLLSQEQDSLYEINEALKRIDIGTYGICEMSGKPIMEIRLEALPFTRFTVECQAQLEREGMGGRYRRPVRSLFGLEGESDGDDDSSDDEETETVDNKQE